MDQHVGIPFLREVVIFLVTCGVVVPVFHRLRASPVLGYLVIGVLIGPFGLGLLADKLGWLSYLVIADVEAIKPLATLGVIFLLFVIGLELSFERLWAMRRLVFGLGSLQLSLCALAIGSVAWAWGHTIEAAIILGMCLAQSSTAIIMQILMEWRQLGSALGRACFSVALFQDLAVVPILFLVGAFGAEQADGPNISVPWGLLRAFVEAAVVTSLIFVVGRLALQPLFRFVSRTGSPEMFVAAILLVVIGTSAITGLAGLSPELGAFLAGLLLAGTEFRHEIGVDIEPFKGLLLGLFFMTVGMGIDFRAVADQALWVLASVVGLFLVKSVIIAGLCLAFGMPRSVALQTGLLLGQAGEFAFVVVGLAMSVGVMPRETGQFMMIVAGLSMLATPVIASIGRRAVALLDHHRESRQHGHDAHAGEGIRDHVIIAGFGRVGRMLARILQQEGVPFLALDLDGAAIARHHARGLPVSYGDASRLEMLRRLHVETAAAIVVTFSDGGATERLVRTVRHYWPEIPLYVRARDLEHARRLLELGATKAVPEALEASLQLGLHVLSGIGMPEEVSLVLIAAERQATVDELQS